MKIFYYILLLIGGGILALILAVATVVFIVVIGGWLATIGLRSKGQRGRHGQHSLRAPTAAGQEKHLKVTQSSVALKP